LAFRGLNLGFAAGELSRGAICVGLSALTGLGKVGGQGRDQFCFFACL
jgi:hypothetical protein